LNLRRGIIAPRTAEKGITADWPLFEQIMASIYDVKAIYLGSI